MKSKILLIFLLLNLVSFSAFGGVDFDGTDDIVFKADTASLSITGDFTIVAWALADTSTEVKNIVGKWGGVANSRSYIMGRLSTNELYIQVSADGTNSTFKSGSVQMTDGTWYHNACVYVSGGSPTGELFVDGNSDGGAQGITRQSIADTTSTFLIGAIGDIGPDQTPPTTINEWDGHITEVAIWNVALSSDEISLLAKSRVKRMPLQIRPSNLVGYWPLNDQPDGTSFDGDTAVDRSGSGNDGIGDDGGGNDNLTAKAEEVLSYSP
ncbi:MAG TPA: LamG domain-containing protein [Candidatus Scalindua sp.]|nr:LamG domain-containing protein [Candidatus Scalindua sp.]